MRTVACAPCHKGKVKCQGRGENGSHPCDRCFRMGRESLCVDWNASKQETHTTDPSAPLPQTVGQTDAHGQSMDLDLDLDVQGEQKQPFPAIETRSRQVAPAKQPNRRSSGPTPQEATLMGLSSLPLSVNVLSYVSQQLRYFVSQTPLLATYQSYCNLIKLETQRAETRKLLGMLPVGTDLMGRVLTPEAKLSWNSFPNAAALVTPLFHSSFAENCWVSHNFYKFTGVPPEQVQQFFSNGQCPLGDCEEMYQHFLKLYIHGGTDIVQQIVLRRCDTGAPVQLLVSHRLMYGPQGMVVGLLTKIAPATATAPAPSLDPTFHKPHHHISAMAGPTSVEQKGEGFSGAATGMDLGLGTNLDLSVSISTSTDRDPDSLQSYTSSSFAEPDPQDQQKMVAFLQDMEFASLGLSFHDHEPTDTDGLA